MTGSQSLKDLLTPQDEHEPHRGRKLMRRLRNYFLAGILVTAPIAITIYLTLSFLNFVDSRVRSILPLEALPEAHQAYAVPGLGIVIAVLFFILIGWFAKNYLGQVLIRLSEYVMDRMPIVRTVYGAIKQIFETVMASKSDAFRDVVMIEYPRKGIYSLGFLTGFTEGEVQDLTDDEVLNVFIPTTPNPTSGFLLFVPKHDVIFLKMSVEDGIKMIVSAGIITPPPPAPAALPKSSSKPETKTKPEKTAKKQ